jgi:hypothetical protein
VFATNRTTFSFEAIHSVAKQSNAAQPAEAFHGAAECSRANGYIAAMDHD